MPADGYGSGIVTRQAGALFMNGDVLLSDGVVRVDPTDGSVEFVNTMPQMEARALIQRVATRLTVEAAKALQVEHEFARGMYLRKLHIPKGTILIGHIHRQECLNIVAKGDIAIFTETGAKRCIEGFTVTSPAGIQKLGYANADTIFINVFLTDETDIETLERDLIWESHEVMERAMIEGDMLCQ
jgi:quercetin dioxygenase-like cupin family protein